jgi:hypothetical protein
MDIIVEIVVHQSAFKIKGHYIFLIESLYYSKENKVFLLGQINQIYLGSSLNIGL